MSCAFLATVRETFIRLDLQETIVISLVMTIYQSIRLQIVANSRIRNDWRPIKFSS